MSRETNAIPGLRQIHLERVTFSLLAVVGSRKVREKESDCREKEEEG